MRVFAVLLMLFPSLAFAAPAIDAQRISDHVRILSSDAFGGRGPATPGGDKAVDYIVHQFAKTGLSPGGEEGTWLQPVPVVRYTITGPVTASARSAKTLGHFEQGDSLILHVAHPGSEVNVNAAPMVFVGYGITAPEFGWDDLAGADLKGKVAIVLLGEPDLGAADGLASRFTRVRDRLRSLPSAALPACCSSTIPGPPAGCGPRRNPPICSRNTNSRAKAPMRRHSKD